MSDIKYWIGQDGINSSDLLNIASSFKGILKVTDYGIGKVFRVGEYVALRDTVDDSREWLLETTKFIVYGHVNIRYYFFVDGNYVVSKLQASIIETDDWTGQPILI